MMLEVSAIKKKCWAIFLLLVYLSSPTPPLKNKKTQTKPKKKKKPNKKQKQVNKL